MPELVQSLFTPVLTLFGVGVGAWTTVWVRRSTTVAERAKLDAEDRRIRRSELKSAILAYLEQAQRVQGALDERERQGGQPATKQLIEQLWLTEKAVELICSEELLSSLINHASALHDVSRDANTYSDWWAYCEPYQHDLMRRVRSEIGGS